MNLRLFATFVLAGVCLGSAANAQPSPPPPAGGAPPAASAGDNAIKIAQSSFDEGQIAFLSSDFDKAAEDFKKAYDARPFPQFLYNIAASYHRKGKAKSDPDSYDKAVTYYKRYLDEEKNAQDKDKVEKAISVLEGEAKRLRATPAGTGAGSNTPPTAPSQEVQDLGDAGIRGLMVIESSPQGASIYLDGKEKGPLGTTPWSGTVSGEHNITVEKRGYKVGEKRIAAD